MAEKPTQAELAELVRLKKEHSVKSKEARTLAGRIATINDLTKCYLQSQGKQVMQLGAYKCQLSDGPVRPPWKDLYIAECGIRKADEAVRLAEPSKVVKVTKEK